jgi:alpha-L-fucosidase
MDPRPLPAWFDDAKFGIFIHWTAAAVPAFAPVTESLFDQASGSGGWEEAFKRNPYVEWYQNSLAIDGSPAQEHHRAVYGDLPYDAFVEQFLTGHDGWQPEVWADLFAAAGAKYVVLVTKHHDGVLLWPSDVPNPHKPSWQSRRDIVGELAAAVRSRGMRFGTYYSGGLDWTFGGLPITDFRTMLKAIPQTEEYLAYADAHWRELIARYEPCVLWNDIGYPMDADLDALFADYFEAVPDGVVNNRFDVMGAAQGRVHADFVTPEYSTEADPSGRKWESCRGIGPSFGFNRMESAGDYLSTDDLVRMVVDVTAHGGNLLLNVGPTGAGEIPWLQAERLLALGWWLRVNGDAIYGTRPGVPSDGTTGDGVDVRYTVGAGDGASYAVVLGPVQGSEVDLADFTVSDGATVTLLGHGAPLRWEPLAAGGPGVRVHLPEAPAPTPAFVLRAQ